jgi:Nuclease-related domain
VRIFYASGEDYQHSEVLTVILKGLDPFIAEDKFEKAGRVAEEQLAFYLRRAFVEDKDILVFNNLRFENNHDVAQIDHLILHKYGMIIIESKSVTTKVEINEREEWIRWFDNTSKGMPSPIQQAKRQGEFLRKYLDQNASTLLGKLFFGVMGPHGRFGAVPVDIIVAISDSGIVKRSKSVSLEEVCKADQVSDRVRLIFERWRKANGVLSLDLSGGYVFTKDEITNISRFFIAKNKPIPDKAYSQTVTSSLRAKSPSNIVNSTESSQNRKTSLKTFQGKPKTLKRQCGHCNSSNLFIDKGHSYYFKCLKCEKDIPIKSTCIACRENQKVRESGVEFYLDCGKCKTSKLFYVNPLSNT